MARPIDWKLAVGTLRRLLRPRHERSRALRCSPLAVSARAPAAVSDKLMIVAHPDDESLFGGEALLATPGWTVICVTHASNPVRRREFVQAMESAGADYTMLDHEDHLENGNFDPSLAATLGALLAERPYTTVVTHNERGEYGHVQHVALHRIVRGLVGDRALYVFATRDGPPGMSAAKERLLRFYDGQQPLRLFRYLAEREALERLQ